LKKQNCKSSAKKPVVRTEKTSSFLLLVFCKKLVGFQEKLIVFCKTTASVLARKLLGDWLQNCLKTALQPIEKLLKNCPCQAYFLV
jgi:hypothetical protein